MRHDDTHPMERIYLDVPTPDDWEDFASIVSDADLRTTDVTVHMLAAHAPVAMIGRGPF